MAAEVELRLGIDVGGTNTDAVVLDRAEQVVAKAKVPTTADVSAGIGAAIEAVLRHSSINADRITQVMLGTTHATNALLQRRDLQRTAVLRIGAPATASIPPLATWPATLREAVAVGSRTIRGGFQLDGREIAPLDTKALAQFIQSLADSIDAVAVTSVFASVSPRHELQAEQIVREVLGDVHVSLSHEIGAPGLIERENATVLNAALAGVQRRVAAALEQALAAYGLSSAVYFSQNDGTLMAHDYAVRYPIFTIRSGPANSMRGAAHLSGTRDAMVADVGGTSTDIGLLVSGFPRESLLGAEIVGVPTNFRIPEVVSLPLGGGSIVAASNGRIRIGPQSVGHLIHSSALVFGGSVPTLMDAAVYGERARIGEPSRATPHAEILNQALALSDAMLAEGIDRAKISREELSLIAVGGANSFVPESVPGIAEVRRPEHAEVANAIGAAIAHVSGQVDRIFPYRAAARLNALAEAQEAARQNAIRAGADPKRIEIVEIEEVPVSYLVDPALRIRVKAAGPLGSI
jgi:N-methylhydantoinase A/oxoprolinase/acetone carboxylase beta subunit